MLMDECVTPRWLIQICPRSCVQQEAPRCCLEEGRGCFPALLPVEGWAGGGSCTAGGRLHTSGFGSIGRRERFFAGWRSYLKRAGVN